MEPAGEGIPTWMKPDSTKSSPVYFLDIRGKELNPDNPEVKDKINDKIAEMLGHCEPEAIKPPVLIKTHIGEPKAWQRLIPDLSRSTVEFFRNKGIDEIVTGDCTVLYSRGRGHRENPPDNVENYQKLAKSHGWLDLGVPFVVLDRAVSSVPGVYEFSQDSVDLPAGHPSPRFNKMHVGGGVPVAGTIVNNVHCTGHGLTGLGICIKGIAMGFADRRGKAQMHMAFHPVFDPDLCDRCGICVTECPEEALEYPRESTPTLIEDKCVGCGQCLAECPSGAIEMKAKEIKKWMRGIDTIHQRLADYFMGIMHGRWERTVHVAQLVRITDSCDCLDSAGTRISPDIGFLVGKNPFAVDRAAEALIRESAPESAELKKLLKLHEKGDIYNFVEKTYGLVTRPEIHDIAW